ncbi:hypothetical protein Agabi119p4_9405 [Agaricus bisporus var. burnettii]|uniref:Uncharacterized protein n=1 Tax=Agaricus bisporus var. burnettii TaxID=192524 RepID=A0A8H7C3B9_AGABI|nr:hypothetical protein Agabi119p4_9405 [Agaricus bisporus var. burnettii]
MLGFAFSRNRIGVRGLGQRGVSESLRATHIHFMSSGFTPTELAELLASSVLGGSMTGGLLVYIYIRCERRKRHRRHDVETCESGVGESQVSDTDPIDSQRESNFIPIQDPPSYEIPTSSLSKYGSNSGMRSVDDSSHLDRILYPTPLHPHMLIHPSINR